MCAGEEGGGGPQNDGTKAHIDTQTHPEGERGGGEGFCEEDACVAHWDSDARVERSLMDGQHIIYFL